MVPQHLEVAGEAEPPCLMEEVEPGLAGEEEGPEQQTLRASVVGSQCFFWPCLSPHSSILPALRVQQSSCYDDWRSVRTHLLSTPAQSARASVLETASTPKESAASETVPSTRGASVGSCTLGEAAAAIPGASEGSYNPTVTVNVFGSSFSIQEGLAISSIPVGWGTVYVLQRALSIGEAFAGSCTLAKAVCVST